MIVVCEKCHIKFKISSSETAKIKKSGRILKCGNCHHMWLVSRSVNPFAMNFVSHTPTDQPLIDQLKNNHNAAVTLMHTIPDDPVNDYFHSAHIPVIYKTILYSVVFFLIITLFVTHKNFLFSHIRPLKPILSIIGLNDTSGLEFEKIQIIKSSFAKNKPLVISGYIINKSDKTLLVPDIRLQFMDEEGQILQSIIHDLPTKLLLPGEKSKIANRIENYPTDKTDKIIIDIGNYLEFFIR